MPTDTAISVEGLSKSYRISHEVRHDTLRDSLAGKVRRIFGGAGSADPGEAEEFWALSDVSFELPRGEALGVVGRNGAGKSTLLKVLSRITEPTRGRVVLRGRVASLLEVGTGFHPELTGRENIFLNGSILGMSRAEIRQRFDAIVDFSGVSRFLDTPVKRYSSGMYVRLAFAVAAHLEPEVLIVDEVLAVGDADFQKRCLGKMGEIAGKGRTVIFVSHNLSAVRSFCSQAILMDQGRCLRQGPTAAVLADYVQPHAEGRVAYSRGGELPKGPCIVSAHLGASLGTTHDVEKPLPVEIVVRPAGNPNLSLNLHIHDGRLEQIVHSSSEFGAGGYDAGRESLVFSVTVPPRLLNVGDYRMTLVLGQRNSGIFDRVEGALSFAVADTTFAFAGTQPTEWSGSSSPRAVSWSLKP